MKSEGCFGFEKNFRPKLLICIDCQKFAGARVDTHSVDKCRRTRLGFACKT